MVFSHYKIRYLTYPDIDPHRQRSSSDQRPPRQTPRQRPSELRPQRQTPPDRHPQTDIPQKEHGTRDRDTSKGIWDQAARQEVISCRMTDVCKNITLSQTSFAGGKNGSPVDSSKTSIVFFVSAVLWLISLSTCRNKFTRIVFTIPQQSGFTTRCLGGGAGVVRGTPLRDATVPWDVHWETHYFQIVFNPFIIFVLFTVLCGWNRRLLQSQSFSVTWWLNGLQAETRFLD